MRTCSLFAVLCLIATILLTAHADETFRDRALAGGFDLSATKTGETPSPIGVILQGDLGTRREWRLEQSGTRMNLAGASQRDLPGGTRIVRNGAKKVTVHPGGLVGRGVTLEVDGGVEYSGRLRRKGDAWPELAMKQRIPKNFRLDKLSSLGFKLNFRIEHCRNASEDALDPALHNAQLTAVWMLHNRSTSSADYLDTIEFGVPLFDARHDVPPGYQSANAGEYNSADTFVSTLEGSRLFDGPTGDGEWHAIDCNLIPLLEEALAAAQAEGFLTDTSLADLHVTSFNVGWEIPGPYECAATLKGLSLDAEKL
jgi:hypothetical protein